MPNLLRTVDCAREDSLSLLSKRTILHERQVVEVVAATIEDVRQRGDAALLDNARRFDAPGLESIKVTPEEFEAASVTKEQSRAIFKACDRVARFHEEQLAVITAGTDQPFDGTPAATIEGTWRGASWRSGRGAIGQRLIPLASAGIYVPGGQAAYVSSVVMNTQPAIVAGVERLVATTPSRRDGTLHPAVLYAAKTIELTEVYKVGGAAAIAALALGTESIPRVDKVVGPGNKYVNEAKRQLWGRVGLDGYAGPSEVCVVADDEANAAWAAADLLTQVEHSEDNAGYLITLSQAKLDEILAQVERQLQGAPREATMRAALRDYGLAFIARDLSEACALVDAIAPEHVTLAVREPEAALAKIRNAGCVLLGETTPESAGDFCLGPSHTLPTSGAARFGSPVSVLDFLKVQSVCRLTLDDLAALRPTIEAFGEMEGFPAHARGASIRFED